MRFDPGPVLRFETRRLAGWKGWYASRVVLVVVLAFLLERLNSSYTTMVAYGTKPGAARSFLAMSGSSLFAGIGLALAFVIAPIAAFGSLSRRRGNEMLRLLMVTPLSGRRIIWQSFVACMIPGLSLWLCMSPFAALLATWWGGEPTDFAIAAAVILSSMAACVATSVAFSLWSNGTLSAMFGVYSLWWSWLLVTSQAVKPGVFPAWARFVNPVVLLSPVPGRRSPGTPAEALLLSAGSIMFAVILLEIASATFRRSVLAREPAPAGKVARKLAALRQAASRRPSWLPGPTLDGNPVLWRECRRARSAWGLQVFWILYLAGAAIATIMGAHEYWASDVVHPVLAGAAGYEMGIGLLVLAIQAGLAWSDEKSAGREGVDLLLSTPLSAATIVRGKWWGVYRGVWLVAVFPLISSIIVMGDVSGVSLHELGLRPALLRLAVVPVVLGQVLFYAAAYVSVGLLLATRLNKPAHAVAWTVGIYIGVALFVPTVAEILFLRTNRPLASGLAATSPIGGPIAAMMTLFSSPYFGSASQVLPGAVAWLLVAAGIAWGLYRWTIARFDRWMLRIPTADSIESDQRRGVTSSSDVETATVW